MSPARAGRGRRRPASGRLRIALTHISAWPEVRRGGERYLHELGAALQDAGHDVRVVTASPGPEYVLGVRTVRIRPLPFVPRRFGAERREVGFGASALLRLALAGLDVWHALGTADAAAAAATARLRGPTSVYTSLGFPKRASRDRRADCRLHDYVVRHIDHYVCLSETTGAYLRSDYGREPTIVSGGVDTRRFVPPKQRNRHPAILFSGALEEPRKNLPLLLEAFGLLRARHSDLELWLSGPGVVPAVLGRLEARDQAAVKVLGLGREEDLAQVYGGAWVTALPSENEAFGLAVLESLACGTPVVTLDTGGASELVTEGVGTRSEPSAEPLAIAIERALELTRLGETADACREVARRYDWRTAIVPELEAIYGGRQ